MVYSPGQQETSVHATEELRKWYFFSEYNRMPRAFFTMIVADFYMTFLWKNVLGVLGGLNLSFA